MTGQVGTASLTHGENARLALLIERLGEVPHYCGCARCVADRQERARALDELLALIVSLRD